MVNNEGTAKSNWNLNPRIQFHTAERMNKITGKNYFSQPTTMSEGWGEGKLKFHEKKIL